MPVYRISINSSWRHRDKVVAYTQELREAGHEVYNFVEAESEILGYGTDGSSTGPHLEASKSGLNGAEFANTPEAIEIRGKNLEAIREADIVVVLVPSGFDTGAEMMYARHMNKQVYILNVDGGLPSCLSVMYSVADGFLSSIQELVGFLALPNLPSLDSVQERF